MTMQLVFGLVLLILPLAVSVSAVAFLYFHVRTRYLEQVLRVFEEKPFFCMPRGTSRPDAERVGFSTLDGLGLRGCYLAAEGPRKGVILFGLEYGSNCWSCQPYCEPLRQAGYDIFAFEPRNQGESESMEGYDPLQWLTAHELEDMEAALRYLRGRPDADPKGVGFFGISKGANAGLMAASRDPMIRCVATDGAFGTYSVMVPYMRKWVGIYTPRYLIHGLLPSWFYGGIARAGMSEVESRRNVRFLHLEVAMARFKRPLLMIHGGGDTYIKVEMARELFKRASGPKRFWVVPEAKHNQALHAAGADYHEALREFFDLHLAGLEPGRVVAEPTPEEILVTD